MLSMAGRCAPRRLRSAANCRPTPRSPVLPVAFSNSMLTSESLPPPIGTSARRGRPRSVAGPTRVSPSGKRMRPSRSRRLAQATAETVQIQLVEEGGRGGVGPPRFDRDRRRHAGLVVADAGMKCSRSSAVSEGGCAFAASVGASGKTIVSTSSVVVEGIDEFHPPLHATAADRSGNTAPRAGQAGSWPHHFGSRLAQVVARGHDRAVGTGFGDQQHVAFAAFRQAPVAAEDVAALQIGRPPARVRSPARRGGSG